MNLKLLIGIVLFVIGVVTAGMGIAGVGQPSGAGGVARPIIAGLSLGIGGLLIGLSFGNWRHPRSSFELGDEVVDPEGYHKMKHV